MASDEEDYKMVRISTWELQALRTAAFWWGAGAGMVGTIFLCLIVGMYYVS